MSPANIWGKVFPDRGSGAPGGGVWRVQLSEGERIKLEKKVGTAHLVIRRTWVSFEAGWRATGRDPSKGGHVSASITLAAGGTWGQENRRLQSGGVTEQVEGGHEHT